MADKTEYDLRQLNHMLRAIDAYLADSISLADLIGTLSFLLEALEDVSERWKSSFSNNLGELEIIHAQARLEARKLTPEEQAIAREIVYNLREKIIGIQD